MYALAGGVTYEQFVVDNAGTSVVTNLTGGGRVFAGPRDDPFFIDLEAAFCILPDRRPCHAERLRTIQRTQLQLRTRNRPER